jgi:Cu(I)/Ag(I) efflux system membrane protein CusA/SilA
MRLGENALATIDRVKKKIEEVKEGLPEGVEIVPVYDRSRLILRAIDTLKKKLSQEMMVVALVCIAFLLHVRSAFVSIFTLPAGILVSFMIMYLLGINANIMSLGGIAIAIGVMVDASVVMVENAHKHLERSGQGESPERSRDEIMMEAAKEVGPALFFSLLIITLSFLPVFTLQAQEGRLFRPLAFTKTFAMAAASVLAITIIPVLMSLFVRGRIPREEKNPISRFFVWAYRPCIEFVLRFPKTAVVAAVLVLAMTWLPLKRLGSEFMPPLYEGDFLWMPTTDPGISITKAREILQQTDKIMAGFPEVDRVFGKIGRAETSTDPAPLSMIETTLQLRPPDEWPQKSRDRWYSGLPLPEWVKRPLRRIWPDTEPARTPQELDRAINDAIQFPGLTNASMEGPIKIRLDMLSTGIRSPVGIKIAGPDLRVLEDLASEVAVVLRSVPGTVSVYPDKAFGGHYLDIEIDRDRAGRYGLQVEDVQDIVLSAIGGMNITETVEGRERYPVNLRYNRAFREDLEALRRVLVSTPRGQQIPLRQVANLKLVQGPPAIKSEDARLNAWIQINIRDVDLGTYVKAAKEEVGARIQLPTGYTLKWSGRFEYMERAQRRLQVLVPLTLTIIFVLLYVHFRNVTETLILLASVPFAVVGGVWLMYFLGYNMSIAAGVGFIALAGLAVETGVVMLVYLDEVHDRRKREGRLNSIRDLYEGIMEGAVMRVRPKLMAVSTTFIGLLPIMIGNVFESGSSVMKRIAAPMVGGLVTDAILTLLILPAVYMIWKRWEFRRQVCREEEKPLQDRQTGSLDEEG